MKHIYYNGVFYLENGMDAKAMGVENGKVGAVGEREEVELWAGGEPAQHHDMKGCFIVPGFNDSHLHLLEYGYGLRGADLSLCTGSLSEVIERLLEYKKEHQGEAGDWIVGRGWNHDFFQDEKRFPDRHDLDLVSGERPVMIYRACGHIASVNSAALLAAGISRKTAQPDGGCFDVDEHGEPTGVLRENGIEMVSRIIPGPEKEEIKACIAESMKRLNARGITSAQSDDLAAFPGISYEIVLNAYRELEEEGLMTVKVNEQCLLSTMEDMKDFFSRGYRTGYGSRYFKIGPLKIISDGSLGARTAFLSRPYEDDLENPENCGIPVYSREELDRRIAYASKQGMQVAVHAIGDRAMDVAIKAMEKAGTGLNGNKLRHGIVHCQITTKELLEKFKELNLHAYIQSIFLDYDNRIAESRLGKERACYTYQFKTLMEMGLSVSNGSDAPVERPDVLGGIQCAVTRTTLDGTKTFLPQQALSVEEALDTYTVMGARASFEEEEKGKLLPGMAADFTVLSRDIRRCALEEIQRVTVCKTFVDGVCVTGNDRE